MVLDAELFVALGFLIFVAILAYVGAHTRLGAAIDARTDRIRRELAEAQRLREEAEALLASFQRKAAAAESEAAAILAQAKTEAELLAKEAADRTADFVARRTKQAEQKIGLAEAQATADVRAAAADAAVEAARIVLAVEAKGQTGLDLLKKGIAEVQKGLN